MEKTDRWLVLLADRGMDSEHETIDTAPSLIHGGVTTCGRVGLENAVVENVETNPEGFSQATLKTWHITPHWIEQFSNTKLDDTSAALMSDRMNEPVFICNKVLRSVVVNDITVIVELRTTRLIDDAACC